MGKIKKVGLITNTYLKEVPGVFYTSEGLQPLPVAVRFTSDRTGETLSFAVREEDREKGVQIIIEFERRRK